MRILFLVGVFCTGCLSDLVPLHNRTLHSDAGPSSEDTAPPPDLGAALPAPPSSERGDGGG
jgi:hypothetical protein